MKQTKRFLRRYRQAFITLAVLAISGVAVAVYFTVTHRPSGRVQLDQATAAVGKLIVLPKGETPTLATVQDVTKLKSQAIFKAAQNGDQVLVYSRAQEIIVYRPEAHKLVAVGPLILGKSGSPYLTSRIAILNGSGRNDALSALTATVVADFPNSTITNKDTAPRLFPNSIVIDLTKANEPLAEQVADSLGLQAGQLPLGITPPNADLLIIIGQTNK